MPHRRVAWALALSLALAMGPWMGLASAQPASSSRPLEPFSGERGKGLSEAIQQLSSSQAGSAALRDAASLPPQRLLERSQLLQEGEAALARLDPAAALQLFERAAAILHAADTEMAIVRAHMQTGDYRRALAFGAHTAGAHLDVVGGAALYAWLLDAGGQSAVAERLLKEAQGRAPSQPLLAQVQDELKSGLPRAHATLRTVPVRLAPYGDERGLPSSAQVVGSALLLHSGKHALLPLAVLPRKGSVWLRNGLGQLAAASVIQRYPDMGLALVQLRQPLPPPQGLFAAPRDAFPGSVAYAVEYVPTPDASPAWPLLKNGFLGGAAPATAPWPGASRELGLDLKAGPRGGPVFNATGQLTGLALRGPTHSSPDRLVPVSALRSRLGHKAQDWLGTDSQQKAASPLAMDDIYELNLRATLQVITAR